MLRASVLLPALLAACVSSHGGESAAYEPFLPGTEPAGVLSVRVLRPDRGTLVPVECARITGWSENSAECERPVSTLLAEGITDRHGFANVSWEQPEDGRPFHWLAEAPGMAVRTFDPGETVILVPGAPYTLRVLTPVGEPLANARVEYFIYGCPHSPSARTGTTGADGRVTFEGLPDRAHPKPGPGHEWGQFWIVADGVAPGPYGPPPRSTLLTRHGRTASGVVVGAGGTPKAGVLVREIGYPRGPVTTTDAQGRFRLVGLSEPAGIAFYDPEDLLPEEPSAIVPDFETDVAIRLTLRPGRVTVLGEGEERTVAEVEVLRKTTPANDVPVRFVRLADGLVSSGVTGNPDDGRFQASLPPGRYRVLVGGGFSSVVGATREIEVPTEATVRFVLEEAARLRVVGEAGEFEVVLPTGAAPAAEVTHLPPEAPAWIRCEAAGGALLHPIGPAKDGARTATMPESVVIRLHLKSADPNDPVEFGDVRWADYSRIGELHSEITEDGRCTLRTYRRGRQVLVIESIEESTLEVTIAPDAREIDLGDIVLHPPQPRSLRVLDAAGAVVRDLSLEWGAGGNELPEKDGTFALWLGREPRPAALRGDGIYPKPLRLSADGPAEVRLPGGRVVIRVRDPEGRPLDSVAYLDQVSLPLESGQHALAAIPAGTHTLIVGARGHIGAVRVIHLRANEFRTIELALPRR